MKTLHFPADNTSVCCQANWLYVMAFPALQLVINTTTKQVLPSIL